MDTPWALPFALQVALGSGYLAYLIAYAGLRDKHSQTEVIFRAVAFGLVATAVLTGLGNSCAVAPFVAFIATIVVGAFWRLVGREWARRVLRATDVSLTDDTPTAWLSITAIRTDLRPSQIVVDLNDGRTLMCDDTTQFSDAPHGPCVFGLQGDIAFYVTSERRKDGEWFDHCGVVDSSWGAKLTYVPAAAIGRVEMRFWTKANGTASAEALAPVEPEEPAA